MPSATEAAQRITEPRPLAGRSLHSQLLTAFITLFGVGTLGLLAFASLYAHNAANASYDRLLASSAQSISENLSLIGGQLIVDLPYAALDTLSISTDDRVFYRVSTPSGATASGYADLPSPQHLNVNGEVQYFQARYHGEPVRFAVLARWVSGESQQGWALVQVGQTLLARKALARELTLGALLPIILLCLTALALVWFVTRRAFRSLQRTEAELAARHPGDLQPIAGPVPAELVPFVTAINNFMLRLSHSVDALKHFIGDAAHQLRTPITALRAQAELALDEDDPQLIRRSLEAIDRNARQLSRLQQQLLSDAIAQHREQAPPFTAADLIDLSRQALAEAFPEATDSRLWHWDCALETAPVIADAAMLVEALKNLLDNARRYGAPDCEPIQLQLQRSGHGYRLAVCDRGDPMPQARYENLFERFQRGQNSAGNTSGAGLGLSIVRRIVQAHGGQVHAEPRAGGGLCFVVNLPERPQ